MIRPSCVHIKRIYFKPLGAGAYCPHPINGGIAIAEPITQVIITVFHGLRYIEIPLQTLKNDPE